ncbi:MAG: holo-ACP synthase [Clostridia bacterium]|nr:holo-ACP synthase [Clostridia bacterium]
MKTYVGTDIIEVDRIEKSLNDKNFCLKVYTDKEIKYCEGKSEKTRYQHYAARFAGKEAVYKAISKFLKNKYDIGWKNIEIVNNENGRPIVNIIGAELQKIEIDISLSHIEKYAIATAIVTIV